MRRPGRPPTSLIKHVTDDTIASAQKIFSRMDSVGQQRMLHLHGGRRDKLEISPNLWAGVGLVRGGAGTALVGDPETVAARIREGIRTSASIPSFSSGYPHLEEAYQASSRRWCSRTAVALPGGQSSRRSASTAGRSARPSPTSTVR